MIVTNDVTFYLRSIFFHSLWMRIVSNFGYFSILYLIKNFFLAQGKARCYRWKTGRIGREKEEQRIETGNGIGSFHYLFNTPTPNNNLADAIIDRNLYSACCYFISRRQRHRCRAIIAADNEQLRLQSLPSTHYHLSARAFIIRSNEIVSMIIRTI